MIITDSEPTAQSPLKARDGQELGDEPPSSPPAYAPYQTHPGVPTELVNDQYRQSPARRFFEAFAVAVMIYVLCATFTSTIVWNVQHHHGQVSGAPIMYYSSYELCRRGMRSIGRTVMMRGAGLPHRMDPLNDV
jgi:hypothetical protein